MPSEYIGASKLLSRAKISWILDFQGNLLWPVYSSSSTHHLAHHPPLQIGHSVDLPGDLLWDDGQLPTSKLLKLLPRETSLFQPDTKESTRRAIEWHKFKNHPQSRVNCVVSRELESPPMNKTQRGTFLVGSPLGFLVPSFSRLFLSSRRNQKLPQPVKQVTCIHYRFNTPR